MSRSPRPRHMEAMRDISPGWASYYAGLYSVWLWLPLWVRWPLGVGVLIVCIVVNGLSS